MEAEEDLSPLKLLMVVFLLSADRVVLCSEDSDEEKNAGLVEVDCWFNFKRVNFLLRLKPSHDIIFLKA